MNFRFNTTLILGLLFMLTTSETLAKTRIYLLAGQSNMMGRAKVHYLPASWRKTPHNVTFYYQGRPRNLAQYSWFGPEVAFAQTVARAFPHDQHIIIKHVATGSSIQQWLPGQALYNGMLRQLKFSLIPKGVKNAQLPPIDAILWMQGEHDARNPGLAQQYSSRLRQLILGLRRELKSPHALFIFGEVGVKKAHAFPAADIIRAQQQQVQRSTHAARMVKTQDLGTIDNVHFDAPAQMKLGQRMAEVYSRGRR